MNVTGPWVAVAFAAAACSGDRRPRQQLATPHAAIEPAVPQLAAQPRIGEAAGFDAEAESSEHLTVWGAPPLERAAEYRAALARVRTRAARSGDHFDLVFEPPFLVIGDAGRQQVEHRAARTVRWAVARLKEAYFSRDPDRVLEVWLFGSRASYRRNTRAIFGDDPDTPYGYYSPSDGALVMNIATGGGTLIHEIVHPFIEANVPGAPAWLNEGMGALYEAASERDGRIVGVLNWRLPGLKKALSADRVPTFEQLTAMSDKRFYGEHSGLHYAQARYLLYYLQEKDLLGRFYREYLDRRSEDKTGYAALVAVLGGPDMAAFQRRWARWVRRLRYRR